MALVLAQGAEQASQHDARIRAHARGQHATAVQVEEERLLVCRVGELLGVIETADERGANAGLQDLSEEA